MKPEAPIAYVQNIDNVYRPNFGRVCLSVCQAITFEILGVESSNLHIWYRPMFREYGSSSYMKVIGSNQGHRSMKVENPYSRYVKLPSAIIIRFYKT